MRCVVRFCALIVVMLPAAADAEVMVFTQRVVASYEFSLLGGTPINPGPTTPFLPFRAEGDLTFVLDASINDPNQPTTVPFTSVTGVLTGTPPSPAFSLPHTLSPNLEFLGGNLTNIVRDAQGEVISADVEELSMRWELIAPELGLRLYTQDGLPFNATNVTIPFAVGTVLSGAELFAVYLDTGNGVNDPLVVEGRNRTLTIVPEPSAAMIFGVCLLGLFTIGCVRRRRAS